MSELTPTGRVILGMIRLGKRTGYDIKQLVDVSTRHFWSASYGQIYPELKRLERAGLVAGEAEPTGGRPRTVYSLTDAGEAALDEWLASREELVWELRYEGLLKVFFSEGRDRDEVLDHIRAQRDQHAGVAEQLRAVDPDVHEPDPGPKLALEFGIDFNDWLVAWWDRVLERVERGATTAARR